MAAKKKRTTTPPATEKHVGTVDHYYPKVKAAAVHLDGALKVGDTIHIKGATDDYTEKVTSMQIDHQPIEAGRPGQNVGVRVPVKVHKHSEVLTVQPAAAPARAKAAPKKAKASKKAARKPARKAKKAKKAARRAPKRVKKGSSGKRSKSPRKRSATKARKVARKTARKGAPRRR